MQPSPAPHLAPGGVLEPELAEHQRLRLREILLQASRAEGHRLRLRRAGVCDADGALTPGWLQAFGAVEPIHRSRVRSDPGRYLADALDVDYRGITSGTRSETFVYFADRRWNSVRQERRDAYLSWWGITPEHPIVNVASRLMPARRCDVAIGGELDVDRVLQTLSGFDDAAFVLRGYPSRVSELAAVWLALPGSERGPAPRAVICTGEVLYGQQRAVIARAFRAPVIDEYGCHETGAAGFSCPEQGRLHLDGVRCLFEQVGDELVTTDLYNRVLPAVRYLCGDLVRIDDTACPCGRPGPTARLLGRVEDRVRIRGRRVPAGAVDLEPLPGVALYRVQGSGEAEFHVEAVPLPPEPAPAGPSLEDRPAHAGRPQRPPCRGELAERIARWGNERFGGATRVTLHELTCEDEGEADEGPPAEEWARALLEEEWGRGLLDLPPPEGSLGAVARLHRSVVSPCELSNQRGMSAEDGVELERLLEAPPSGAIEDELLAARVLLWASAHRPFAQEDRCHDVARRALHWLECAIEQARDAGVPVAAAVTDVEIARRLVLAAGLAPANRPPVTGEAHRLDALNAHHLLAALEHAWTAAPASGRPPALAELRPLLAVVISDAQSFAADLGPGLLPVLAAMLGRGRPLAGEPPVPAGALARRWWRFRMALCGAGGAPEAALAELRDACEDEHQVARWQLETAYLALCRGQVSDPEPWLDLFHHAAPLLGEDEAEIDLLPWVPLLRRLGPELHRRGRPDLAYQCLALSTAPSSRISAFDRLTRTCNVKQAVLHDDTNR